MNAPLVSVILPVYNGANYLRDAVKSILDQSFTDFECLIINDGSTDDTAAVVASLDDPRIRLHNQANMGLAATLNQGLALARGQYIARQDHDDLSLPQRFEKQVTFLKQHPDYAMVGTRATILEGDRPTNRFHDHPADNAVLKLDLLFNNPFVHSSLMLRRDAMLEEGGFTTDRARQPPEDYELWSRLARRWKVANIPERLVCYREVETSICRRAGENPFLEKLLLFSAENIAHASGLAEITTTAADAAALAHAAPHRLSPNADIDNVLALVRRAAESIDPDHDCPVMWIKLDWYFDNLVHHYVRGTGRPAPRGRGFWSVFSRRALSRKTWRRLFGLPPK